MWTELHFRESILPAVECNFHIGEWEIPFSLNTTLLFRDLVLKSLPWMLGLEVHLWISVGRLVLLIWEGQSFVEGKWFSLIERLDCSWGNLMVSFPSQWDWKFLGNVGSCLKNVLQTDLWLNLFIYILLKDELNLLWNWLYWALFSLPLLYHC